MKDGAKIEWIRFSNLQEIGFGAIKKGIFIRDIRKNFLILISNLTRNISEDHINI
jgi:hypothetical protein